MSRKPSRELTEPEVIMTAFAAIIVIGLAVLGEVAPDALGRILEGLIGFLSQSSARPFDPDRLSAVADLSGFGIPLSFNWADLLIMILGVVILIITLMLRAAKKKYPIIPVPEYYPPKGMNPAEVGYIIDGHVGSSDMTALIYYWASHGHLSIAIKEDGSFELTRQTALDDAHTGYERELFDSMWTLGTERKRSYSVIDKEDDFRISSGRARTVSSSRLSGSSFSNMMRNAARKMRRSIDNNPDRCLNDYDADYTASVVSLRTVVVMAMLPMAMMAATVGVGVFVVVALISAFFSLIFWLCTTSKLEPNVFWSYLFFLIPFFAIIYAWYLTGEAAKIVPVSVLPSLFSLTMFLVIGFFDKAYLYRKVMPKKARAYRIAATVLAIVLSALSIWFSRNLIFSTFALIVFHVCALITLSAANGIRRLSEHGSAMIARCMGYRQFLETAEKDRLEMLIAEDPDYYYTTLPYVHALGVSKAWMDKDLNMDYELPNWFSDEYGPSNTVTSAVMTFMDDFAAQFKKAKRKARRKTKRNKKA